MSQNNAQINSLILFYDSYCPLCMTEMRHLKKRNGKGNLTFVDINHQQFSLQYPQFDHSALNARIHGLTDQGQVITGLDVTHQAWRLVGVGWLYAPLRWPPIRPLTDWMYIKFAKHRYRISFWLTGKARCEQCKETL